MARAPTVMTLIGSTFHPTYLILSNRDWYFSVFLVIVSVEKQLLQYVNSINCMVMSWLEVSGAGCPWRVPQTHSRSSLNLAWHCLVLHVHGKSYDGTVYSVWLFWKTLAFIKVKHLL